jgi:hypothetical protein
MTNSIAPTVLHHYFQGLFLDHSFGLFFFQDRGGLTYPNKTFMGLVKQIAATTQKILPLLEVEKTCQQISNILYPHVEQNPMF